MLNTILSETVSLLNSNGIDTVYSVYDNIPIPSKGSGIFTVAGIDSFESSSPIHAEFRIFLPFKAEVGITLIAPLSCTMAELYSYFDTHIVPLAENPGSLSFSLKSAAMKTDSNIGRLILKAKFSVSGITSFVRRSE